MTLAPFIDHPTARGINDVIPITDIIVCTTCRPAGASRDLPAAGLALFEAVAAAQAASASPGLQVRGTACMSGCSRGCTVALQAPGKPTYYFGDLTADVETAAQVLTCARLHLQSADGSLPRNARPERLRAGILAKLPPFSFAAIPAA